MKKFLLLFVAMLCLTNTNIQAQDVVTLSQEEYENLKKLSSGQKVRKFYTATKGFEHSAQIGLDCLDYWGSVMPLPNISYIAGYRFNNWLYVGGGVGVTIDWQSEGSPTEDYILDRLKYGNPELEAGLGDGYISGPLNYPANFFVFANIKTYFTKTKVCPFATVDFGGRFSGNSGVYFSPAIGVNFKVNEKLGIYFDFGYELTTQAMYKYSTFYNAYRQARYDGPGGYDHKMSDEEAIKIGKEAMIKEGTYTDVGNGFRFRLGITFGNSTLKKIIK